MGFFSDIIGGVGDVLGIGESATDYARKAGDAEIGFLEEGLDYAKPIIDERLGRESQAADQLLGFYSGDQGAQQSMVNTAMASPFYNSMIDQGRQGVGASLSATGGLRGGMGPASFYQQDQNTLQSMVNRNLAGLQGFANPVDMSPITNLYSSIGDASANKYQAIGQAKQDKYGQMLGLGTKIAGMI